MNSYKALVVHSGGMDSSICLAIANQKYGSDKVISLSFNYNQRHSDELNCAKKIANHFGNEHHLINLDFYKNITVSSLLDSSLKIESQTKDMPPNTMVIGRNGLMARIASIYAHSKRINNVYLGVIEVEEANSGYRDCSRKYIDLIEKALRIDFADTKFNLVTPVIKMNKLETMKLADNLGVLEYLLEESISCYDQVQGYGCGKCPACKLRNEGIKEYLNLRPHLQFSYKNKYLT